MNSQLNIAIVAGGNSSEAEISLRGAAQMAQWLDSQLYVAHTVLVSGTQWTLKHPQHGDLAVSRDDFSASDELPPATIAILSCEFIGKLTI